MSRVKIDRLIGILSVLLQRRKATAPKLAERFGVSKRTINHDIEDLRKAGIPIRTAQETGGGISIVNGYRVDRTILISKDTQMILAGLRSLDSVSGSSYYKQLMEKVQARSSTFIVSRDSLLIDLSSWYRDSLVPKIEAIQGTVGDKHLIKFRYYAPSGESERALEPYYLVFRWSSWYLWDWCLKRKDFRLFKLSRMGDVHGTDEVFECREASAPDLSNEKTFPGEIRVKALPGADQEWGLVEEFDPSGFIQNNDGRFLFIADCSDIENLVTWIMAFGDKAELFEPVEIRERIASMVQKMTKIYKGDATL